MFAIGWELSPDVLVDLAHPQGYSLPKNFAVGEFAANKRGLAVPNSVFVDNLQAGIMVFDCWETWEYTSQGLSIMLCVQSPSGALEWRDHIELRVKLATIDIYQCVNYVETLLQTYVIDQHPNFHKVRQIKWNITPTDIRIRHEDINHPEDPQIIDYTVTPNPWPNSVRNKPGIGRWSTSEGDYCMPVCGLRIYQQG